MARRAPIPRCSEEDRRTIEEWASSRTMEARLVERAKIIKKCLAGLPVGQIAADLSIRPNTVIAWRKRFEEQGIKGLNDRPRSGKPRKYDESLRDRILETLEQQPPKGQARWDGAALSAHLGVSDDAVWRVLRREGIFLSRQRSWCVSTDPEFTSKAADIVGLYLNPPENAIVISLDEKPSIQALERARGYVCTNNGKIVQGLKSTYKRHGTLNLFAALNVATGAIHAKTTQLKRRVEFLEFMDELLLELPADREIHVILDNYCIHKRNNDWLKAHQNVTFHFTPTSASWLNMIEIWFGILSRKALKGASFGNVEQLRKAIEDFIEVYQQNAKPFLWRKREVKGSQLKNTIVNLCN
ncbi:IS630 family transposase [Desulfurispirillum indicum]|uniref:Putative transposase n=1 Tax=Desulfurispirillum indicum (strain ATCC BAA-1389 / DSM 22839 / S5) TaxID=653733 RepID=E6W0H5_DESIS|nr:IS630 family transposase [Desulfurispirillum indicum]ADU65227.1 putative transposase [Desulfurispirillum indicum S5]ADU65228.1 putative transposase [Desulfurispirillum indicum S5]UCZ55552.1 IS630 family transposase [Desulfurispirillum indicum]UCZ56233.1 IS630 family transposase [Desulfurispirillum indicum]UCZ56675.1 IS630 family transposase [Desulfurispirillum indicum]